MNARPAPTRLKSLFLFPLGAAFLAYTLYTLRSDGTYYPKLLALGIMLVCMSALGVADPRLLNPWHPDFAQEPRLLTLKVTAVVLWVVMLGVGFYPVIGLEQGWWLPEPLVSAIRR